MEKNIKQIETPSCTFQEKSKEIDLVQSLINRMANSQSQTKTSCINVITFIITCTLVTLIFLKSTNEVGSTTHLIWSLFPKLNEYTIFLFQSIILLFILCVFILLIESFCTLDRNFLRTEKIYRTWYKYIIEIRDTNRENLYLMDPMTMQEILKMHNRIDITKLKKSTNQSWGLSVYRKMYLVVFVFLLLCCLLVF